jgi:mannan endo-1,4-beta-mannosidase
MLYIYIYTRLSGQGEKLQNEFVRQWAQSHLEVSQKILRKPLIITEFGKSRKHPGFTEESRDAFLETINNTIYSLARSSNGCLAGGLIWQIFAQGMESYSDGYEIELTRAPSMIARQAQHMFELTNMVN